MLVDKLSTSKVCRTKPKRKRRQQVSWYSSTSSTTSSDSESKVKKKKKLRKMEKRLHKVESRPSFGNYQGKEKMILEFDPKNELARRIMGSVCGRIG
jgi:hypothetical protein